MTQPLLSIDHVSKIFGGVHAVEDVSLAVPENAVYALIGSNGAGKSTLFNLVTNIYAPDAGEIHLQGQRITGLPPHRIAQMGVIRTFQTARIFPHLTVLENVLVGAHRRVRSRFSEQLVHTRSVRSEEERLRARALSLLEVVALADRADDPASVLPLAGQKYMELVRVLMADPKVLLLDEPAAGMIDRETSELSDLIRAIRGLGITVLLVEHNMAMVMGLADYVAVMDAGRLIAEGPPKEVQRNPVVIEAFFGRDTEDEDHA